MDKSESQIRRIVVQRMDRCSVCHRTFGEEDVEVVSRKQDMWMMIVQCRDCQARSFVAALVGEATYPSSVGQLLDLSAAELTFEDVFETEDEMPEPPEASLPINEDDVSAMRDFLVDFNGDFRKLFGA